jgi:purine nucleosidase/pyrimidine-specific ribonucleoside hydrolase
MKRVILDMDPGVDDALAIILAMLSPELKVQAITTVSGNVHVDLCTRNVRRVLEVLKPEKPPIIARGEAAPLAAESLLDASGIHGQDGLGDLDRFTDEDGITKRYPEPSLYPVSSDHAVDVILSMVVDHPHEITLIPTGPLTNIARAIIQDPERMKKFKEIVIMGGAFTVPGNVTAVAEFNILIDPHAADVVVNSGLPITFVGLDVTHRVRLQRSHMRQEIEPLNTRLSQFIRDITSIYMDFHRENNGIAGCYLHDPLAVGVTIDPSLVKAEDFYVQVETQGEITLGMTVADLRPGRQRKGNPNVCVCTSVDADRFLTLFLDTIKGR